MDFRGDGVSEADAARAAGWAVAVIVKKCARHGGMVTATLGNGHAGKRPRWGTATLGRATLGKARAEAWMDGGTTSPDSLGVELLMEAVESMAVREPERAGGAPDAEVVVDRWGGPGAVTGDPGHVVVIVVVEELAVCNELCGVGPGGAGGRVDGRSD